MEKACFGFEAGFFLFWDYFFRRVRRIGVRVRIVKRVVGSGIAVARVKLFLTAKRSLRSTVPSWFASPLKLLVPKYCWTFSRSSWFIWPSSFVSPRSGACVAISSMSLPSPPW